MQLILATLKKMIDVSKTSHSAGYLMWPLKSVMLYTSKHLFL